MGSASRVFVAAISTFVIAGGSMLVVAQPATDAPAASGMGDDAPATRPARRRGIGLVQPWSKVADLSEEQKVRLDAIHKDAVAKIKAIQEEERTQCMAILTDEQRSALQETLEKEAAARKKPRADAADTAGDADKGK